MCSCHKCSSTRLQVLRRGQPSVSIHTLWIFIPRNGFDAYVSSRFPLFLLQAHHVHRVYFANPNSFLLPLKLHPIPEPEIEALVDARVSQRPLRLRTVFRGGFSSKRESEV